MNLKNGPASQPPAKLAAESGSPLSLPGQEPDIGAPATHVKNSGKKPERQFRNQDLRQQFAKLMNKVHC